jgi:uncharacterized protein YbjT (DUF2867 family)
MNAELRVMFGAGQVGYPLAERLLAAGKRVRIAKRSSAHVPPGCEVVLGNASDQAFCATAATTVYHCSIRLTARGSGLNWSRGIWTT